MELGIGPYILDEDASILDALKHIDINKKGFLLVIDRNKKLMGTLTDGDIRRSFMAGKNLTTKVKDICQREYKCLFVSDDISQAIDLFKNSRVKFLPIVDAQEKVVNILTKAQMHVLLLLDIQADLLYDFNTLDEGIIDYEIFQRPWGFYKTTAMNDYFQSKIICVNPLAQISLQSHNHREEHWIIAHGVGKAQIGDSLIDVKCGSSLFIPKGCRHRITNTDTMENLIIAEVQIGDYFGEDDIVRYEDIYGRS